MRKLIGHCGVDSGTIMIVDPCYVVPDKEIMLNPDKMKEWAKDHKGYSEVFDEMHKNDPNWKIQASNIVVAHVAGDAVISHTHDGDGSYPVYANLDGDGRVESLTIEFI